MATHDRRGQSRSCTCRSGIPFARIRHECEVQGIQDAVQRHDSAAIFDWLLEKMQYQGMSDANVNRFLTANPTATWSELREGVGGGHVSASWELLAFCRVRLPKVGVVVRRAQPTPLLPIARPSIPQRAAQPSGIQPLPVHSGHLRR